ncbi:MAG: hypothetical protein D6719_06620 [Candidatus Dadabacteria bacterium]|nr:MAG: hypothetical protein D6719_06620 [Candidatus Dadabacteria bacterium]
MPGSLKGKTLPLTLLIKQIFDQLDELAQLKKSGSKANISQMILDDMCSVLKSLPDDLKEHYLDLLVKIGSSHTNGKNASYTEEYAEMTLEAKKKFLERIVSELRIKVA